MKAKSVPRGAWQLADRIGIRRGNMQQPGTTVRSLRTNGNHREKWIKFVEDHFDQVASETDVRLQQESETTTDTPIRTCSRSLNRLMRDDLTEEMLNIFNEQIEKSAVEITDNMAIVRASILKYVAGDGSKFRISSVIPTDAIRDDSFIDNSGCALVSPPSYYSEENDDYVKLFGQEHLQYMHQQYLGHSETSADEQHPLWKQLKLDCFDNVPKAPTRLSQTVNSAVIQYAKDLANIWKGPILQKAAEYLVRILLRLKLAPERERRLRELVKRLAQNKKEKSKINKDKRSNRDCQRQRLYEEKKYYQKCESRLLQCKDEEEYHHSQIRLQRINEEWEQRLQRTQKEQEVKDSDG